MVSKYTSLQNTQVREYTSHARQNQAKVSFVGGPEMPLETFNQIICLLCITSLTEDISMQRLEKRLT